MTDTIYAWSQTADANASADTTINFAEFQQPKTVNNSARALMKRVAELVSDQAPKRASTGSANAYAVSSDAAGVTLRDGEIITFIPNHTNTGACTLNVDGRGAKPWRPKSATAFLPDNILSGVPVTAYYNLLTDEWLSGATGYYVSAMASGIALQSITARLPQIGDLVVSYAPAPGPGRIRLGEASQNLLKADYPELSAYLSGIGYPWGSSATTFTLPPAAGYFLRVAGTSPTVDTSGARAAGTVQADQNKAVAIPASGLTATTIISPNPHDHAYSAPAGSAFDTGTSGGGVRVTIAGAAATSGVSLSASTSLSGAASLPGGDEVRVKNVAFHLDVISSTALAAAQIAVFGFPYQWDVGTADSDPGSGRVRINAGTLSTATHLYVSKTDGWGVDLSVLFASLTVGSVVGFSRVGGQANRIVGLVTGAVVSHAGYVDIPIGVMVSGGSFSSNTQLAFEFNVGSSGGGGGGVLDGDKGDIVVSSVGTAWTIDANVVTNAKLTDMPANTIKGNNAASSSDPADLTVSQVKALLAISPTDIAGLGTSAVANTGTSVGNVPVIGVGGVLPASILPAIAITDVYTVASQVAMLSLSAQRGDVAIRTDDGKTYILSTDSATTLADWKEITVPGGTATGIADNLVSNAKLTDVSSQTIKGRIASGVGDPEDLNAAQVKSILSIAVADVSGLGALATASSVNLSTQATGTLQAAQHPALTGDVTSPAGSLATTIASQSVSNAKLAQMPATTIKGNNTGASATPADLTVSQVAAILPAFTGDSGSGGVKGLVPPPAIGDASKYLKGDGTWGIGGGGSSPTTTRGDIIARGEAADQRLAIGTTGYLLGSNGTDPEWGGFVQAGSGVVRTWQAKGRDIVDLRDFGTVDLTGASDMKTIVQLAINETAALGVTLRVPPGTIRLDSKVDIPVGTHIVGCGKAGQWYTTLSGLETYFHFNHSDYGFEVIGIGRPRSIVGCNFYRTQPTVTSGWAPTNHNFDIQISGVQDLELSHLHFHNSSKAINVVGHATHGANGRISIHHITGQPLVTGIALTHCLDCVYVDEVHFWPVWNLTNDVIGYTRSNAVGFQIGRVDNAKFGRIFAYGYYRGSFIYGQGVSGSLPTGTANLFSCAVAGFDNCNSAVVVDPTADGADLTFGHLYGGSIMTQPAITSENIFQFLGPNLKAHIGTLYGYNTNASLLAVTGSGGRITVGVSTSANIDANANGDVEFFSGSGCRIRLLTLPTPSAAAVYGGSGVIETPEWRSYTPTASPSTGAFTSYSASGRYRRQGNTIEFMAAITVTNNGTGSGFVFVGLPTIAAAASVVVAREVATTGLMCSATITAGTGTIGVVTSSNGYPVNSGAFLIISGVYETT